MNLRRFRLAAVAALALPLMAGCRADDEHPLAPSPQGGTLFARYVALGNSITAGYQSSGLTDSLQARSYPALLAQRAGAGKYFFEPFIAGPGCPKPMTAPLVPQPAPPAGSVCFQRTTPPVVSNLAVPGEKIGDLLHLPPEPTLTLHRILIGDRTQLDAMAQAKPSFVSIWIGNNDALQPALSGEPAGMTPAALFAARADSVAQRVAGAKPQGAVFIGVVDPKVAPLMQPGKYFFLADLLAKAQGAPGAFPGKTVSANCAPGTPGGDSAMVALSLLGSAAPIIDCSEASPAVLSAAEQRTVTQRVTDYNAAIKAQADKYGYLYLDPNVVFGPAIADPVQVRKCQGLAAIKTIPVTPTDIAAAGAAIQTTCPALTDPKVGFGTLISFDGVHPSSAAHVVITQTLAGAINSKYGTSLATN
jgi:lysophospholipase L1-like esterase